MSLTRLKPFDNSNPDGRAKERWRRAILTSGSAAVAKAIAIAGPLITIPIVLVYLGREQYGLWMTVIALVGMFSFADLGLGNGLMTEVSQANGHDDLREARRCIASTFFTLMGVSLALLCFYAIAFPFVPWSRVLNTTSPALVHESGLVVTICFLAFLANLPLGIVQRSQWGLQEGFRCNLWQCAGSVVNVAIILIAVKMRAPLAVLVMCVAGVPIVVNVLNGWAFFSWQCPGLRPRLQDVHWATAQRLLKTGFWFFLVSILGAIGIYSDNVVVAQVLGLKTVPLYSVPANMAGYLSAVASMVYAPFWTANGEALARGDSQWVRSNAVRIMRLNAVLLSIAGLIFVLCGPILLHWWIGPEFSPGRPVLAGMAAWALLLSVAGPVFMILNGANVVRVQVIIFGLFAPIAIVLKVILARRIGIAGVAWASVVPYAVLVIPTAFWAMRRLLESIDNSSPNHEQRSGLLSPTVG